MLRLLARREHSAQELRAKLLGRGFAAAAVDAALAELADGGQLDEGRYTESYIEARRGRGFGPLRIRAELRARGVPAGLVEPLLKADADDWTARLRAVHDQKFGTAPPADPAELGRRARFLEQRGFALEQILRLLKNG